MSENKDKYVVKATIVPAEDLEEPEVAEIAEENVPEPSPMLNGIVSNCTLLNVRVQPDKDAAVISMISAGSHVEIDSADFGDWYSIWLENGIHGFCMKDYITIQQ